MHTWEVKDYFLKFGELQAYKDYNTRDGKSYFTLESRVLEELEVKAYSLMHSLLQSDTRDIALENARIGYNRFTTSIRIISGR